MNLLKRNIKNANGKWDWGVFWIHGIIAFFIGFFIGTVGYQSIAIGITIGVILGAAAGFLGDKFWLNLRKWLPW
jgi:hypothetical protein